MCVIEAMRASLPVIASDVGGMHECVEEGKNGFLVARGSVQTMRSKLQVFLPDPLLRERLGSASRRLYEERFPISGGEIADQTAHVYERVLAPRRPATTAVRPPPSTPPGEP